MTEVRSNWEDIEILPASFFIQITGDFICGDDDVTYVNGTYHLYLTNKTNNTDTGNRL